MASDPPIGHGMRVPAMVGGMLGLLFASWASAMALKQFAVMLCPSGSSSSSMPAFWVRARLRSSCDAFGLWPCTRPRVRPRCRRCINPRREWPNARAGQHRPHYLTGQMAIWRVLVAPGCFFER